MLKVNCIIEKKRICFELNLRYFSRDEGIFFFEISCLEDIVILRFEWNVLEVVILLVRRMFILV